MILSLKKALSENVSERAFGIVLIEAAKGIRYNYFRMHKTNML